MPRGGARKGAGRKPKNPKPQAAAPEAESAPVGRPSKFDHAFVPQAEKLAALGATDIEVADFFGINVRTLYAWKNEHSEFSQALKVGKSTADDRVERSLFQRAIGYEQDDVKIFMPANAPAPVYAPYRAKVAPDTTAAIFWLKNRRPDLWRDRSDITVRREVSDLTDAELAAIATGRSPGVAEPTQRPDEPDRIH